MYKVNVKHYFKKLLNRHSFYQKINSFLEYKIPRLELTFIAKEMAVKLNIFTRKVAI